MALVEQLGDDSSWYVQLAAICCWHLPLCICIMFLNWCLILSIPCLHFSLIWYWQIRQNGWWYQHVLAVCALLTGVILKGLIPEKCMLGVCVYLRFMFAYGLVLWSDLKKKVYVRVFWSVHLPMTEFDLILITHPHYRWLRWSCEVDRMLKSS